MLKRSFYNIEVDKLNNGDILLYNSFSGAFGIMDSKTQTYYNKDQIDPARIDDTEINSNIKILQENGFLVALNLNEFERLKVLSNITKYSQRTLGLTIAPTLNCNMKCPYCYEEKTNNRMNEETIANLINFVKNKITVEKIEFLSITWYGGEPLLELETIRKLSRNFLQLCTEFNVGYSAGIVSNAILFDQEIARILKDECKIEQIQITIDGIGDTNNKRRLLKNGKDSFSIITNHIDACKDIIHISIRVNVDKSNLDETQKIINYIIDERGWKDKVDYYFAPVTNKTDACKNYDMGCLTDFEFGDVDSQLLNYMYSKEDFNNIEGFYPRTRTTPCMAVSLNNFVVDPDGDLYTCWDIVGIKNRKVGDIINGATLNSEYVSWLDFDISDKCKCCNMLPICQGGCPFKKMQNNSNVECNYSIYSFKECLKLIYKNYIYIKNKNN